MTDDVKQSPVGVRDAGPEDAEFLLDMLLEAVNWTGEERVSRKQLLRDRRLAHYVAGWQREGDLGVIAVDLGGPAGLQIPVGAAWLRRFNAGAQGYGYVADDIPELSMGVAPAHRGRGIGRGLLRTIASRAQDAGNRAISLSVEKDNPAVALYTAAGFRTVAVGDEDRDAQTMLLDLLTWTQPEPRQ
ncbi:GNAT family N-acetyltransferase [Pseudactinotalea suaedae]|jgi:ribosomal protein S18 acetylase RimI-like enzyme|uniref:GNAT family N-acetyltransferase n=1 Tax=Pseudactinotalea suaedae TaxID=1524924 RepID=UPI0012E159CA|nr:GNAT family N-acetyltransferase [Pseudactinotalea suaedae]